VGLCHLPQRSTCVRIAIQVHLAKLDIQPLGRCISRNCPRSIHSKSHLQPSQVKQQHKRCLLHIVATQRQILKLDQVRALMVSLGIQHILNNSILERAQLEPRFQDIYGSVALDIVCDLLMVYKPCMHIVLLHLAVYRRKPPAFSGQLGVARVLGLS